MEHEDDFRQLKALMCNNQILHCPDESREFLLHTDASGRGIGAVLSQLVDEVERPVAFFSRKLLPRETRYSAVEKECLGVVAALKHFDVHLVGRKFTIITDHKALVYLQSMQNANPRLTRWALAVQPFSFQIVHRPGRLHGNADGLSRQAWPDEEDTTQIQPTASQQEGRGEVLGNPIPNDTGRDEAVQAGACTEPPLSGTIADNS